MSTLKPPHTCVAKLEQLGIKNLPAYEPEEINFTRFMRYLETESYPDRVVDDLYRTILENPADGKKQLYKLVFDILVFAGIAHDLDALVETYRVLGKMDPGAEEEIRSAFGSSLYAAQVTPKKRRKRLNPHLREIAYDPKNFRAGG